MFTFLLCLLFLLYALHFSVVCSALLSTLSSPFLSSPIISSPFFSSKKQTLCNYEYKSSVSSSSCHTSPRTQALVSSSLSYADTNSKFQSFSLFPLSSPCFDAEAAAAVRMLLRLFYRVEFSDGPFQLFQVIFQREKPRSSPEGRNVTWDIQTGRLNLSPLSVQNVCVPLSLSHTL